jgi:mannitol 2-dehydrogenase
MSSTKVEKIRLGPDSVSDIDKIEEVTLSDAVVTRYIKNSPSATLKPPVKGICFGLSKFGKNFPARVLEEMGAFGYFAEIHNPSLITNFNRQHGLYHDAICHPDGSYDLKLMGSMLKAFDLTAPVDAQKIVSTMVEPDFQYVFLTHTKFGYWLQSGSEYQVDLTAEPIIQDMTGTSVNTTARVIVEAIRDRQKKGRDPFIVLSCDNAEVQPAAWLSDYAKDVWPKDPKLARYILDNVPAPETMVDSITIGYTDELAEVLDKLGIVDPEANAHEEFCFGLAAWDPKWGPEPSLWNWEFVTPQEIKDLREAKRVVVNAVHFGIAMVGATAGIQYIEDVLKDPTARNFIQGLSDGYRELLDQMGKNLGPYSRANTLDRFSLPLKDTCHRVGRNPRGKTTNYVIQRHDQAVEYGANASAYSKLIALWVLWNAEDACIPSRLDFESDDRRYPDLMNATAKALVEAVKAYEVEWFMDIAKAIPSFAAAEYFPYRAVYHAIRKALTGGPLAAL